MTATAKSPKLSQTMEEALVYLGRGSYRAHLEPEKRTVLALERRGMIEWAGESDGRHDTTMLWNVTAAGWAFLKDAYQIERPADAGRLTVEEALTDAEQIAEDDRTAAADWDAAYALEDAEELARVDAGRLTVEEALELTYSETPTAAERAEDLATGKNGLIVLPNGWTIDLDDDTEHVPANVPAGIRVQITEDAESRYRGQFGVVQAENRGVVENPTHPNFRRAYVTVTLDPTESTPWNVDTRQFVIHLAPVDAALDQAEADAKDRLDAVVKQQARDDRPKASGFQLRRWVPGVGERVQSGLRSRREAAGAAAHVVRDNTGQLRTQREFNAFAARVDDSAPGEIVAHEASGYRFRIERTP